MRAFVSSVAVATIFLAGPAGAACSAPDGGKLLASNCFQCHGTNGNNGAFSALAGVGYADMINKMNDFRTKPARSNIMIPHARGYTPEQIQCIADFFSKLPKP